ncbi:hypothetical protein CPU12_08435 [Malaciobacter molluscorum LMG 25693]|uniref:ATP-grasp domain-containing protein n=1 Tax=Malaciobacter molluscorum LMG 25693 TaxID=870501 RepID=A0A2G1DH16_9BACT|nr:Cj0069 family protein [Malaciobacter molluscorum]AXX93372.1 ATP-grasp domain-containing protein [Malaciobacter molluscorum LMG 25693]PHO17777.1 hypothetical protein CPU12_08435 [Malaciobacter molluscorum LMG 25693]
MKNKIFIIECNVGSDKGFDGFRADTKPILNEIEQISGFSTEVVFYSPSKKDELFEYLNKNAYAIISRINPGNLKEIDEYFQFLNKLSQNQIEVHTHPDVMINLDFKDILYKLKDTKIGEKSTKFYQKVEEFNADFPQVLKAEKIRVLKTNYGSTGEGVYLVKLNDNGTVTSTEAVNNEKEKFSSINDFMTDFAWKFEEEDENASYFKNKKGFVSCKYLKRINEGEIRVLLVKDNPICIVHKQPQAGEFSATLFSGAKYNYESASSLKYKELIQLTKKSFKHLKKHCNNKNFPILWTMDYILDYDENKNDKYVLSEINCSCVGITTHLEYAKDIAKVFRRDLIINNIENSLISYSIV